MKIKALALASILSLTLTNGAEAKDGVIKKALYQTAHWVIVKPLNIFAAYVSAISSVTVDACLYVSEDLEAVLAPEVEELEPSVIEETPTTT